MGEGREASGDPGTGLVSVSGVICGSSVVPTLRLLPFVVESDIVVLDSDIRPS